MDSATPDKISSYSNLTDTGTQLEAGPRLACSDVPIASCVIK